MRMRLFNPKLRRLHRVKDRYPRELGRGMRHEAEDVLGESLDEVPVDTGFLASTGEVKSEGPFDHRLGYGTDYALIVHENLEAHHPVGKAKYLIDPFNRAKDGIVERLIERIHSQLGI